MFMLGEMMYTVLFFMVGGKVSDGILLPHGMNGKTLNGGLGRTENGGRMSRGIKVGMKLLRIRRIGRKQFRGREARSIDKVLVLKGLATDLVLIQIAWNGLIIIFITLSPHV